MSSKIKILFILLLLSGRLLLPGFNKKARTIAGEEDKRHNIRQLVCQEKSFLITGWGGITSPPLYKDYFAPIEEVWVALNPQNLGPAKIKARLYILNHKKGEIPADGAPLEDVSKGYEKIHPKPGSSEILNMLVWKKPGIREEGYDVVVDFEPFGIYNKGRDIIDTGDKGGFYVPGDWVCLNSLAFNHNKNTISGDALTLRVSKRKVVRIPEWERGNQSFPVAYTANKRVTVCAKFRAAKSVSQASIAARTRKGKLDRLKNENILFDNGTISKKHFPVFKDTPAEICAFLQIWKWYLRGIRGKDGRFREFEKPIHIAYTINRIYNVLALPQSPWEINQTQTPWSRVLELSTEIARGKSTPEEAAGAITKFFYENIRAVYTNQPHYSRRNPESSFSLIKFTKKIRLNKLSGNVKSVNCYDMAKAVVIFANVLGCDLQLRYFESSDDNSLQLRCVEKVGWEWRCEEFFENHAFAGLRDKVFDASLRVDARTPDTPAQSPPIPEWMINITWEDYKKKVLKAGVPTYPKVILFKIIE